MSPTPGTMQNVAFSHFKKYKFKIFFKKSYTNASIKFEVEEIIKNFF